MLKSPRLRRLLVSTAMILTIFGVFDVSLHEHNHRVFHSSRNNLTGDESFFFLCVLFHDYFCFSDRRMSASIVKIRAISRRSVLPSFTLRVFPPEAPNRKFHSCCRFSSSNCPNSFSFFCFNVLASVM